MEDQIILRGMRENNLKNIDLKLPKNKFIVFTGISGSGKSSVVFDTIAAESRRQMEQNYSQYLRRHMELHERPETDLMKNLTSAIVVNQKGIGISTRSTLATYMGIMDDIRNEFSKNTGQPAGLFSFNSLGACPTCGGKGYLQPDVAFADPVTMICENCDGTRYSQEALSYTYEGKSIVEILELTVKESLEYFEKRAFSTASKL